MNLLNTLILSVVEGLTEFLPISSTGHLILASKLLNIQVTDFTKTFEIIIQLGAIMAVAVLYFRKLWTDLLTRSVLVSRLMVAFIPTAIVGFALYPLIKTYLLGSSTITLWALFVGGLAIIIVELLLKKKNSLISQDDFKIPTTKQAFLIGCFQSISIIPGVSRAAATIIGARLAGLNRKNATEFSFLLAIPTMFAASVLDIYKSRAVIMNGNLFILLTGTIFSFIFALIAVKFLINFVKNHDFTIFGIYRIILAIIFWIFIK